jgi:hypothetical protein
MGFCFKGGKNSGCDQGGLPWLCAGDTRFS